MSEELTNSKTEGLDYPKAIHYPFERLPEVGIPLEVAPGVHWLRMPLPFVLDHINLWLIEDTLGVTAVDTGIAMDAIKAAWRSALAKLPGGGSLKRQIVTHFHPDHLGLAAWLETETGAPLYMTQGEYMAAQLVAAAIPPFDVPSMADFFRMHGLEDSSIVAIEQRGNAYRKGVPGIPKSFHRLIDGDILKIGGNTWQIIVGYGHAPEHASLYSSDLGVLIAGDMLLPRISTNVSSSASAPELDVLKLYLDSITRLTELPANTLVLPSHGRPFRGLHARVAALQAHHAARCDELIAACTIRPHAAAELLPVLFGRGFDDPHQTMFAMGEAIAHLIYLENLGRLERSDHDRIIQFGVSQRASL